MIIVDTNVLSELLRPKPDARVIAWLDRQPESSIWTTSVTVLEISFGLQIMLPGKRRDLYTRGFERLLNAIDHRVAPFDTEAAQRASALMASRKINGLPRDLRDSMIAGIVLSHHAALATRNISHFDDVSATLIDPWISRA